MKTKRFLKNRICQSDKFTSGNKTGLMSYTYVQNESEKDQIKIKHQKLKVRNENEIHLYEKKSRRNFYHYRD